MVANHFFQNRCRTLGKPSKLTAIKTDTIDGFVAKRRTERGKKVDSKVSPATINRELRHLKAALNIAHDWGYLPTVPKIRKVKEADEIGQVITAEHFQLIYGACHAAKRPGNLPCTPEEWWQALLVFGVTTGGRIPNRCWDRPACCPPCHDRPS